MQPEKPLDCIRYLIVYLDRRLSKSNNELNRREWRFSVSDPCQGKRKEEKRAEKKRMSNKKRKKRQSEKKERAEIIDFSSA